MYHDQDKFRKKVLEFLNELDTKLTSVKFEFKNSR